MRLKERLLHTDLILLTGLFLAMIKTFNSLSIIISIPEWPDSLLTLGMCGCYGLHVLLQRPSFQRLAAYGAAALIGAFSALRSGDMMGMITLLTCIALADCDWDRVMSKLLVWNLAFFLINSCCALVLAMIYGPEGPLTRFYENLLTGYMDTKFVVHLGYGDKNIMGMHIVNMFLMWLWLRYRQLSVRKLLAVAAVIVIPLVLNQTKTAAGAILIVSLMAAFFLWRKQDRCLLVQIAAALSPTALLCFSIFSAWLYRQRHPVGLFLNRLTTGRFGNCANAWEQYGLTFTGHLASEVAQVEGRVLYMDNVFLYALVQIGILWAIAFCIAFFLLAKRSEDIRVHLLIACWCMYSLVEINPINGLFFMPALLPALLLSSRKTENCIAKGAVSK